MKKKIKSLNFISSVGFQASKIWMFFKKIYCQGNIQEFNVGVGSHTNITLWCKFCSWGGFHLYETHFLLTTHTNFSVLNFKLGVQANYPLARVFFFHTLATAFPTFYHVKTACSCWVWKFSNDACPLYIMHFIIYSMFFYNNFSFLKVLKCRLGNLPGCSYSYKTTTLKISHS